MNIQNILDQTALIVGGGPTVGDPAGMYRGAGAISDGGSYAVKVAYSRPPNVESLANDGLSHLSFWDGMTTTYLGNLIRHEHRIRMQLKISEGRGPLAKLQGILTGFVQPYITAFSAKVKLNGAATVSYFEGSPGIVDAIYPDRIALELVLIAVEKEPYSGTP